MHCEKEINEESLLTEVWLVDPLLFIPPSIHQFPPNLSGENNPPLAISVPLSSASCSTPTRWVCAEGKSASSSLNGEFGTFQAPEKHTHTHVYLM